MTTTRACSAAAKAARAASACRLRFAVRAFPAPVEFDQKVRRRWPYSDRSTARRTTRIVRAIRRAGRVLRAALRAACTMPVRTQQPRVRVANASCRSSPGCLRCDASATRPERRAPARCVLARRRRAPHPRAARTLLEIDHGGRCRAVGRPRGDLSDRRRARRAARARAHHQATRCGRVGAGRPPRRHAGTVRVARRRRGDRALTSAGGDGIAAAARTPRGERWGCERVIRTHDPDVWPACPVRIPGSHA
ncbi:hypothetical protein DP49_3675 [Burkholderia pseudomallei]|nr:hypothetical protein DP49_3675 [Burkholderia pseudomallei]